ncbi:MAG: EAL domain-containing protein [Nitrospirota bacterium]
MPAKRERELLEEIESLRARAAEAEETISAIRSGELDALVVSTPEGGDRIFTLKGAEAPYRTIVESINEGAATLADSGIVLYANARLSGMLGIPLPRIIGSSLFDSVREQEHDLLKGLIEQGLKEHARGELSLVTGDGGLLPVSLSLHRLAINGEYGLSAVVTDISERKQAEEALRKAYGEVEAKVAERKQAEEALRQSKQRLDDVVRATGAGYYEHTPDMSSGRIDARFAEVFGYTPGEVPPFPELGRWLRSRICEEDLGRVMRAYKDFIEGRTATYEREYRILTRHDQWRWVRAVSTSVERDGEGRVTFLAGLLFDITERKRMEETIRYQAYHDALTGLPNRMLFNDHLTLELTQARRHATRLAVLFLDLDRFKMINDTLGHQVGDELLGEVALRLKVCVRQSDTVARLGGDEFAVLLPNIAHAEDAAVIAEKIIAAVQKPFALDSQELYMTTSIGISMYPGDGDHPETLLKNADIAMYHAKGQGRNNYQFYNAAMNIRTLERMILESNLRRTLDRGELLVYYQPQVDLATRMVVSAEALVRWQHPELGLLNPMQFIPMAEETGLILPIDEWVLRTACNQNRAWQEAGLPPMRITVNVSARQFVQPHFSDMVSEILYETRLRPRFLELEITENIAMRDIEHTIPQLQRLTDLGIGFSIDDFGSGYTSLGHLKNLPVKRLKIDRSFIRGLIVGNEDRAIVNAVVIMAHSLKMKVVAEGVETEEQVAFLRMAGCDEVQGFFMSEPLPSASFERYLTAAAAR